MDAALQELPKAYGGTCEICRGPAVCLNVWRKVHDRHSRFEGLCERHAIAEQRTTAVEPPGSGMRRELRFDNYYTILLAYVGDEMWISLECWTRLIGEQVRIMDEMVDCSLPNPFPENQK